MRQELEDCLSYILNDAAPEDLELLEAALQRRKSNLSRVGLAGFNPERAARSTAATLRDQMGFSKDAIRNTVREMAIRLIREQAPELSEDDMRTLLEEWVPDAGTGAKRAIPPDALRAMVRQFVAFSTGTMSAAEQGQLRAAIPDWQKRYWDSFGPELRKLLTRFLKGELNADVFEKKLDETLFA